MRAWEWITRILSDGHETRQAALRERAAWNREPIRKRIDAAVRHAVAVGFRRYAKLSAKAVR